MTNPEPQDERRSFSSRTPVNDNLIRWSTAAVSSLAIR
jgi:hypothetical protein